MHTPQARLETVRRIATEVTGPAAVAVDHDARFPRESFAALKEARLLSACVPTVLGGAGATIGELATMCETLSQKCASTGMIFAMHQIQVACLTRHGADTAFFRSYLGEVVAQQRLIASVTSEAGVGGSVRTSISPIMRDGACCSLKKDGTVVSYGEAADDLLITVRRSAEAAAGDQALVLVRKNQCALEQTGSWDTFGMRGTSSPGYIVTASFPEEQIVPAPFAEILQRTMVPFAHILWGAGWLGIASDAVARARAFVRGVARQMPGTTPPQAIRLSEVAATLQLMRAQLQSFTRRYDELIARADGGSAELSSVGFGIEMNNLKISSSRLVAEIVTAAMRVCGMSGYRNDGPFSLTRQLRDAHSAALMIGNDRIHASNATLHLVYKDDLSS